MGAKVRAYDPVGMEQAKKVLPELTYCDDAYDCAKGADALVIVTEWEQFRALDLDRLKQVMAGKPVIVDLRNIYPARRDGASAASSTRASAGPGPKAADSN